MANNKYTLEEIMSWPLGAELTTTGGFIHKFLGIDKTFMSGEDVCLVVVFPDTYEKMVNNNESISSFRAAASDIASVSFPSVVDFDDLTHVGKRLASEDISDYHTNPMKGIDLAIRNIKNSLYVIDVLRNSKK